MLCLRSRSSHLVVSGIYYHFVAPGVYHLMSSAPEPHISLRRLIVSRLISLPPESFISIRRLRDFSSSHHPWSLSFHVVHSGTSPCHLVASRVFQCAPGPLISSHCTRSHSFNNETYYRNRTSHLFASGVAHLNPSPPGSILSSHRPWICSFHVVHSGTSHVISSPPEFLIISLSSESLIST